MRHVVLSAIAALTLAACTPPAEKAATDAAPAEPTAQQVQIQAPAGEYKLDPNHSSLLFRVRHMGMSNYTARFTRFDGTLTLDPANPTASSVNFTVEPGSISVDNPSPADYRAWHAQRPYRSWSDDLARSPEFFNSGQFPQASFRSTRVEATGPNTARITGDLTLRGQTHPITLDATVVGSAASRMMGMGPAIGFSATGTFSRSQFGMTHLVAQQGQPEIVGDQVTIDFNGEFQQPPPAAPDAGKAKN